MTQPAYIESCELSSIRTSDKKKLSASTQIFFSRELPTTPDSSRQGKGKLGGLTINHDIDGEGLKKSLQHENKFINVRYQNDTIPVMIPGRSSPKCQGSEPSPEPYKELDRLTDARFCRRQSTPLFASTHRTVRIICANPDVVHDADIKQKEDIIKDEESGIRTEEILSKESLDLGSTIQLVAVGQMSRQPDDREECCLSSSAQPRVMWRPLSTRNPLPGSQRIRRHLRCATTGRTVRKSRSRRT